MEQKKELEVQKQRTRSFQLRYELAQKRTQEQFWTKIQNKLIENDMNEYYEGPHNDTHLSDEEHESQSLLRYNFIQRLFTIYFFHCFIFIL